MLCDEIHMWEDLWKFRSKYFSIAWGDAEAWAQLSQDLEEIRLKYNTTYCNCLLIATVHDLEEKARVRAGGTAKYPDVMTAQFYKSLVKGTYDV